MQNVLFALVLGSMFSISFISCSDDDDDHVDGSKLIGNWEYTGKKDVTVKMPGAPAEMVGVIENYIKNSYQPFISEGDTYTIGEGDSFSISRGGSLWMGDLTYTYSKSNSSLKIYMNSGKEPYIVYDIISVTDNSAILRYTYDTSEIHWNDIEIEGIKMTSATALIHLKRTNTK